MQVSYSYPPWCSSLALLSAQDSSKRTRLWCRSDRYFHGGNKIFRQKWSAWTDIPEILFPRTNFSAGPKFPWQASTCFTAPPRRLKQRYQVVHAYKQACTNLTGPSQPWNLLSRSSLAHKQAYTCFTAPWRWIKRRDQVFPTMNRLALASQDFHSSENCFLNLPWHLNSPPHASQYLLGGFFPRISTLARATQHLHRCENCFLDLPWHLNRLTSASQHLLGG